MTHRFGTQWLLIPQAPGPVGRETSVDTPAAGVHPCACLNCLWAARKRISARVLPKLGVRVNARRIPAEAQEKAERGGRRWRTCISVRAMTSSAVDTDAASSSSPTSLGSPRPCSSLSNAWIFVDAPRRDIIFAQASRCSARTTAPRTTCTRSASAGMAQRHVET